MEEIHLDKAGDRIILRTRYVSNIHLHCKSVSGYAYDPETKAWTYPLNWKTCLDIRQKIANPLGRDIAFGEEMYAWAVEEKKRQQAIAKNIPDPSGLGAAEIPGVKERNAKIYEAAIGRPFQTVGIAFGAAHRKLILGDDPGLGKTLQTLGIIEEANVRGPILVVCNTSAQQVTWPHEIEQWTDDEYLVFDKDIPDAIRDVVIREVFRDCNLDKSRRIWVIMNPYWVRMKAEVDKYGKYVKSTTGVKIIKANVPALFTSGDWAAIIADESHETLACSTGNLKKQSQQRVGMGALPLRQDGIRISISGTPMRGKPVNMFGQLNWINPEEYTSYWKWAERHFVVTKDGYEGAFQVGELKDEHGFYEECSRYMLRRSKSQVAQDLPPKQYGGTHLIPDDTESLIGVWLPMAPEQKKEYENFVNNDIFQDEENGLELTAVGFLAELTRLKQWAASCGTLHQELQPVYQIDLETGNYVRDEKGRKIRERDEEGNDVMEWVTVRDPALPSNKFQWLLDFLDERDLIGLAAKGKGKVLVASQFRKVLDLFRHELLEKYKTPSFHITGATKISDRKLFQDEFQNNPDSAKIFFLQSVAGGTSLTLDQADDVVILDEMWDEGIQAQIEDRAHRLSRLDHNVTIWYLRSLDTIEEAIGATVEERRRVIRGIMDGQRGVSFAKKLLIKEKK